MKNHYPVALVILDGFGYRQEKAHNAINPTSMPFFYSLLNRYPWTTLKASGAAVGLPEGTIGNSEVGHMTIGLGLPLEQPLTQLNNALDDGTIFTNTRLTEALNDLARHKKALHIIGLFSDTGVHSSIQHLYAYLKAAHTAGVSPIYIHAFLDGRDTAPHSAGKFLEILDAYSKEYPDVVLASVQGRYYAMDRDQEWDLTEQTYRLLTQPALTTSTWQRALEQTYQNNMTEEFTPPTALYKDGYIRPGDGVIFFNFRPDRARQLTALFIGKQPLQQTELVPVRFFITPVSYGPEYPTLTLFDTPTRSESLIDQLDAHGYTTFTIAETTKYAHVTYFFNGGREVQHHNETRILVPSYPPGMIKQYPCMRAQEITTHLITSLQKNPSDFYLVNYANADMVGHTGDETLTQKSLSCLDKELEKLFTELVVNKQGILIITGDHGNAEDMFDEEKKQARTAHTTNPVYLVVIDTHHKTSLDGTHELKDIAPYIRKLFNI